MENNKIHIEELIREIDAEKRKGPELDADKIIRQANLEIERRELQRKKRRTGYIATASILVAVICVSFTYISLESGSGFANNFRQIFFRGSTGGQEIVDNFIDGENKDKFTQKTMTLDEIKQVSLLDIKMPQKIIEGYELDPDLSYMTFTEDIIYEIKFYFNNYKEDKNIEYIIIPLKNRKTRLDFIDNDKTDLIKKTENEIVYTYSNNIKEENIVYWGNDEICYSIVGKEDGKELLKMALSI